MNAYEAVIGLEVHVHLQTKTKAFCGCSTEFGKQANTQTCPVCLGFPGSLPVLNQLALEFAIKAGLALNCQIQEFTKFDRKNYFYPDLPKNFQISQYDLPLCSGGFLEIDTDTKTKRIGITRIHLEEDAGKLIHKENKSLVDFNRSGVPLLEIVSEPEISSVQEAYEYLSLLKSTLEYLEVSDCDMEKGSLRCDANISVRVKGQAALGVKTELKNMNSFKGVRDALTFEIERQTELLENGKVVVQETRLWDGACAVTVAMRTKEEAKDYRYFPEPDLAPFVISEQKRAQIAAGIPELPRNKMLRLMQDYRLGAYHAKLLVSSKQGADFAQRCLQAFKDKDKTPVVNWLCGPLLSEANSRSLGLADLKVSVENLLSLIEFVESGKISGLAGKTVLAQMVQTGKSAAMIIEELNLAQISDTGSLEEVVSEVLKENAKSAADYQQGKNNALMFLVGAAMKKTKGKANPKVIQEILKRRLANA